MLKAYIDESYTPPATEGTGGIYYVGCLLVNEQQDEYIRQGLQALRESVSGRFGVPQNAEFHGYCMFQYKDDWKCMKGLHAQAHGIYKAAMRILAESHAILIIRGIDVTQGEQVYGWSIRDVYSLALHQCLARVNFIGELENEEIVVVADKVEDAAAQEGRIRLIQENTRSEVYGRRALANIDFPFHWEDSREFLGLQMVDMALFMSARAASVKVVDNSLSKSTKAVLATANLIKENIRHSGVLFSHEQKVTKEIF